MATLQYVKQDNCSKVAESPFLYFTNLVTYYTFSSESSCSPELHNLIVEIEILKQSLDINLEVEQLKVMAII